LAERSARDQGGEEKESSFEDKGREDHSKVNVHGGCGGAGRGGKKKSKRKKKKKKQGKACKRVKVSKQQSEITVFHSSTEGRGPLEKKRGGPKFAPREDYTVPRRRRRRRNKRNRRFERDRGGGRPPRQDSGSEQEVEAWGKLVKSTRNKLVWGVAPAPERGRNGGGKP